MTDLATNIAGAWAVWAVLLYIGFSGCKANDISAAAIAAPLALVLALAGAGLEVFG